MDALRFCGFAVVNRVAALGLLVVAGCGTFGSDDGEFVVRVSDADGVLEGVTAILELDENDADSDICATTDANGKAVLTWDVCGVAFLDCDSDPYAVRVSKDGYLPQRKLRGFSQSDQETFVLEPCTDDCETQEVCGD